MRRYLTAALAAALTGCATHTEQAAQQHVVGPGDCVYAITLDKAMPNDSAMIIHLNCRDGMFGRAVAMTPRFTRAAHTADAGGLKFENGRLHGEIKVTINSDGYVPAGWQTEKCAYRIDATLENSTITGKFDGSYGRTDPKPRTGSVSGQITPLRAYDGLLRLKLGMENAKGKVRPRKGSFGIRGFANITFKNGKAVHGTIRGHGGNPINYFEAAVTGMDLRIADSALTGILEVQGMSKTGKDGPTALVTYLYTIDAAVAGDQVGGTFQKKFDGEAVAGGPLSGRLVPVPDVAPANALYRLELHNAVAGTKQLMMYIASKDGKFSEGSGFSGTWNHTFHDVHAQDISLNGNTLAGDVKVTLNPDPYVPKDRKPVPCAYTIKAVIKDGYITGSYTGKYRDKPAAGVVKGELREKAEIPEPVTISVKLDNGVCDGAPWHRRCYINFVAKDGRASEGGVSNNKGGFKGKFQEATVDQLDDSSFKSTIKINVYESGKVLKGDYVFHLAGKVIGDQLVGKVDTELNGKTMKQGTDFMGAFRPAR